MIISREYDDALWCMLFAEKKNREEILEFITELPQEVLDYARSLAKQRSEFLETDDVFDDDDEDFEDDEDDMVLGFFNSRTDPSIEYYVNIEEDDGSITIEKSIKTKQLNKKGMEITEYEQLFELIILPMNQEKIDSLEDLDFDDSVGWIGTITNKEKEYDYDLREREANLYIRRTRLLLGDRVEVPSYTKLNLNDLPHELDRGNMTRALKQKNKK